MERLDADAPIACSLNDQDFRDRRALARTTLKSHIRQAQRLENSFVITFAPGDAVRENIETFIALEQQCCGFLNFRLSDAPLNEVVISGPPEASATIDMFAAMAQAPS